MSPVCRLYLITPPRIEALDSFVGALEAALGAGDIAALQVRLKPAGDDEVAEAVRRLGPPVRAAGASLILNDRPDLAAALRCDGVHVGQGDPAVSECRRRLGSEAVIGATCHDSRHLAMEAADQGADYVAFGAFFPTATKETTARPDLEILSIWQETMLAPCVAIGGITVAGARGLAAAGADFLAVSSGVWSHADGPAAAVSAFEREIAAGLAERDTPAAALPAGGRSPTSGR